MAEPCPAANEAGFHKVAEGLPEGQRLHLCLQGRYVTLLRHNGKLSCIDSVCFHAGGPLGIGDIEEVNGNACLVCPWHYYKVDIVSGEKYYQSVTFDEGQMVPGDWKSNGPKQRVHFVEERPDGIHVQLQLQGVMASDKTACNTTCGDRMNVPHGKEACSAGGDGGRSGQVLAHKHVQQLRS